MSNLWLTTNDTDTYSLHTREGCFFFFLFHYVTLAGLELTLQAGFKTTLPASAFRVLGIKMSTTVPGI